MVGLMINVTTFMHYTLLSLAGCSWLKTWWVPHLKKNFNFSNEGLHSCFTLLTLCIVGWNYKCFKWQFQCVLRLSEGHRKSLTDALVVKTKEDLHRKLGIFILPLVSDWTNVFIVTRLSYADEELRTNLLACTNSWLVDKTLADKQWGIASSIRLT